MDISVEEAEQLKDSLCEYGHTQLIWVTAEFAPFTSSLKPDIYFAPTKGPYTGRSILIELYRKFDTLPNRPIEFFTERTRFAEEYLGLTISRFVILNGHGIDELLKKRLAKISIVFLDKPACPKDFLDSLGRADIL